MMELQDDVASIENGTLPLTAFNARTMSARQVAETFVAPSAFANLRKPVNTLLSGPRGSGKTTLLKMLQPMALELWDSVDAVGVSAEVPYVGVFIATDRTWKRQLEPAIESENPFKPELDVVANSAFTIHVLRELVLSMRYQLSPPATGRVQRRRSEISLEGTKRLIGGLARLAQLEVLEPSLDGIVDALSIRMAELSSLRNSLRDKRMFPIPAWTRMDCLSVAETAIGLFNRATNNDDQQWALLFDEMELAPTAIVSSLLDAMRGQPQNLLLKLSLSPIQPELAVLHLPHSGVHGQDFELIQLFYPRQKASLEFGTDLFMTQVARRGIPRSSVAGVVGPSLFSSLDEGAGGQDWERERSKWRNPYAKGSPLWKKFKSLAQIDKSFRDWLGARHVDLDDLSALSSNERASKLRKVRNLVVVREYYMNAENKRRSRKSYELYCGADSILTVCDGNARMLTALTGQLLAHATFTTSRRVIPLSRQSEAIESIIGRFFALVNAVESVPDAGDPAITLSDLLHRIGEALAAGVLEYDFRDNVPLSFTVDRGTSPATIRLLHLGINAGAFVHLPQQPDRRVPLDLLGEQFRLTYVLAPYFGLPLRLGPSVSLSTLLQRGRRGSRRSNRPRPASAEAQTEQGMLFSELDQDENRASSGSDIP